MRNKKNAKYFRHGNRLADKDIECFMHKMGDSENSVMMSLNNTDTSATLFSGGVDTMRGYAIISEHDIEEFKKFERLQLKFDMEKRDGDLGTGVYFVLENKEMIGHIAKKRRATGEKVAIVMAELDLKNCLNLLKNEGQNKLNSLMGTLDKGRLNDCELFNKLDIKSKIKYDSVLSVLLLNRLHNSSKIYQYMSQIVCVKNIECIVKYYDIKELS